MAGLNKYYSDYDNQNKSRYEKDVAAKIKILNQATNDAISGIKTQKAALPQQYQGAFDTNEIQYLLNQKQLEERMANMGLTDSGLNRTQETALVVQKMNTDAAYNQKKQAAISILDKKIAELQQANQQNIQSLKLTELEKYNTARDNYAIGAYKADQKAAAAAEAARIKAQNTTNSNKRKDFSTKLGYMSNDDLSDSAKLAHIYDYINYYDEDINSTTFLNNDIKTLLSAANITESDWQTYMRNRLGIASIPQAYSKEYTSWLKASKPSLK